MKKSLPVYIVSFLLLSLTSLSAKANNYEHTIRSMCNYIVVDHKSRFREQLKTNKVRLKHIYSDIKCNGLSLLRFAMAKKAHNVGKYIVKRLPTKLLRRPEADGMTIRDWAKNNGQNNSPIALAIAQRANI